MKGIVGKKLGMTQIFDPETGGVTPVTVIEAGPCPVVVVRTEAEDGYDAVQLAYEPVAERKISKGEIGHLAKNGVEPHRHIREFRGPTELVAGETVTVEAFEAGDQVKVSGIGIGKGFAGDDQAAQLPPRARLARLAQRARAGLDRRVGDAVARLQGHEDGRPHGRQAPHAARPERPLGRRRAEPHPRQGRGSGPEERPRRDQGAALMASPKAPLSTEQARSRRTSRSRPRCSAST
jgi:hypothetical protein